MKQLQKLSTEALLTKVRYLFSDTKTPQTKGYRQNPQTLADCLMSALAMFGLKFPSLLQFDEYFAHTETVHHNLKKLYKIKKVPTDTTMRERLDEVDPIELRKPFKSIFALLQRGNILDGFKFLYGYYLLSIDGTGFFSSSKIHCISCCEKNHKDGSKTYYHQMFCGAIVHPKQKTVIPFAPEPILKCDGDSKNDCELNATKRFIADFRREHPHLNVIVTADSLSSKSPTIKELKNANMRFILGAKPGDHKSLFEFVKDICLYHESKTKDGKIQKYRYTNNVPINDSNHTLEVNFLELTEIDTKGKQTHFSWVTDIPITKENITDLAIAGRTRWKIENEVFNTLKNQNYHFEHNFGHGAKNLSTVFGMLMLLAFMIDQVQELCDNLFQQALLAERRKSYLWIRLRSLFFEYIIESWNDLWSAIAYGHQKAALKPLNST